MKDTKENILQVALGLFARDGYEAVSVSEIAGALGITKGALYRHYAGKRDIFDSILARMEQEDAERAGQYRLPEGTLAEMQQADRKASFRQLTDFCRGQFRYWTEDPFASAFRRMLTLEQYRSREMAQLYQQYLAAGPLGYTADLLAAWEVPQPKERAAALYAPMFLLYSVYDGAADKAAVFALLEGCLQRAEAEWEKQTPIRERKKV